MKTKKGFSFPIVLIIVLCGVFNLIAVFMGLFTYPFGIMTGIDKLSPTFVAALLVDISIVIILIDLFYSAVNPRLAFLDEHRLLKHILPTL